MALWRVLVFRTARGRDWFRSSARALFGDANAVVFPLGKLVLRQTTGHPASDALVKLKTDSLMKALPVLDPKAAAMNVGIEKLHVSIATQPQQASVSS